jgi:tripartite-type tricarboxylate transporter receptor subunit TctC
MNDRRRQHPGARIVKATRRDVLRYTLGAAAVGHTRAAEAALDYPTRPVRIVIGFPPGGTLEYISRLVSQKVGERLGQPFVIESRPGASSNLAAEAVLHTTPDGYTLLACTSTNTINATLYEHLNFDFPHDIAPVAGFMRTPAVIEVNPSFPAKTIPEFIAYAKANPGLINMGSAGIGSFHQVAGELFMMMTGTKMVHVPYRGEAPALTALLGNQIQVMFTLLPSSVAHIRAGDLRALAVTTAKRLNELPDVPAASEFIAGYEASSWQGLVAPKDTPANIVQLLNTEINTALADPAIIASIVGQGAFVFGGSAADFGTFIATETEKWGKVVRAAHIKVD